MIRINVNIILRNSFPFQYIIVIVVTWMKNALPSALKVHYHIYQKIYYYKNLQNYM